MLKPALILAIMFVVVSPGQQDQRPSVVGAPTFVSLEGRFSISLPNHQGFREFAIPTDAGLARGNMYEWRTKEATFNVAYADHTQTLNDPETVKRVLTAGTEYFKQLASQKGGNVREAKVITLDKYPGIEQRVDLFIGSIIHRIYIVEQRVYYTTAVVNNDQRAYESLALSVLDSFKILSMTDVAARIAEQAAKAEPSPLPQAPIAQRAGTDATDEGLRGHVKSVLTETEDLSSSVRTRKRNFFQSYNEQGNTSRAESYDEEGKLFQIIVYGYIDGSRVSASKFVNDESIPPVRIGVTAPATAVKKSDSRYHYRYEFKYDEKTRLIEQMYFDNRGDLWLREVYKYKGNQREERDYSADGSLTEHHLQILDDKGNAVEETTFDIQDDSVRVREAYSYDFDSKGNWIKRTTFKIVMKDGREQKKPQSVDYRTITYY